MQFLRYWKNVDGCGRRLADHRAWMVFITVVGAFVVQPFVVENAHAEARFPRLHLVKPNGGELWVKGDVVPIKWRSNGFTGLNVHIELLKSGVVERVIADVTENDGKFRWLVPSDVAADTDYKVRIISLADPTLKDRSNDTFAIVGV